MKLIPIFSIFTVIFLSGCTIPSPDNTVIAQCVSLCENALNEDKYLSNGPCLSDNESGWTIENWVCDVAHSPRQDVDNQRENQCDEWWEGYDKGYPIKFVEVTSNCEFIKTG